MRNLVLAILATMLATGGCGGGSSVEIPENPASPPPVEALQPADDGAFQTPARG